MKRFASPASTPLLIAIAALWLPSLATAQTVTFDFDTGPSPPPVYSSLPVDQTIGGVRAHFAGDFSFQTDGTTFFHLSQFSGKYLDPKSLFTRTLDIQFDQELASISLTYATIDYQDNMEVPSNIRLTAYKDLDVVGSATTHAFYGTDTYPMETLSLSPTQSFNKVSIVVPYQPNSLMLFIADNITVTVLPRLAIALTDTNTAVLSWPAPSTGFVLQESPASASANWINTTNTINVVGDRNELIAPLTDKGFFRLSYQ